MASNQQVLIDSLPQGKLSADNYRLVESDMPVPEDGEVLVKTIAFAITAGTRAGLQGSASYAGAPTTGVVMNSTGVGEVIESRAPGFAAGDRVIGPTGWQAFSAQKADGLTHINPDHDPVDYLGPLGVNGLTAYFGLLRVGQPAAGETVMVSAAAGSVGHLVGQIAKIKGARVVGVCGSDEKGSVLTEKLGFDSAVNYKDPNYRDALKAATPDGVDVYFDNTGGAILGSALFRMNVGGRVACCGVVSQYDTNSPEPGPKGVPGLLVNKRITMRGFLVFDFSADYAAARDEIAGWLADGRLIALTDEVQGLAAAPEAFVDLLAGGNLGTRVVRLD
ncbi:MAG: NADP-dependent oxidoreductase [Gammaproteobacteria bacterium]|jgi:NADPH-dependent curcumin reductase CurA|nr:MAG: NADP-dependent oxidoreductase [Gammaproteobacteria bacterium]